MKQKSIKNLTMKNLTIVNTEFTGAQIFNQLEALTEFLKSMGYNVENLTLNEICTLKAQIKETINNNLLSL